MLDTHSLPNLLVSLLPDVVLSFLRLSILGITNEAVYRWDLPWPGLPSLTPVLGEETGLCTSSLAGTAIALPSCICHTPLSNRACGQGPHLLPAPSALCCFAATTNPVTSMLRSSPPHPCCSSTAQAVCMGCWKLSSSFSLLCLSPFPPVILGRQLQKHQMAFSVVIQRSPFQ